MFAIANKGVTMKPPLHSRAMRLFRKLGWDPAAWALRRFYCPVARQDLVLEVGSGGNPYFRSNVLCDAYRETSERHFEPLIHDRPTVLAFAEDLPFRNDSFDFVIASHVLEHSERPDRFLSEIQRVGKAGYIEVPDAFFERILTYDCHRLEISERKGALFIRKKRDYIQDKELYNLVDARVGRLFSSLVSRNPFEFHVRYYWTRASGGIKFEILNPDYEFDWSLPVPEPGSPISGLRARSRRLAVGCLRRILSQSRRNRGLDVLAYLECIKCRSPKLERQPGRVRCRDCGSNYGLSNEGIVDFTRVIV